jgi:hypothetical protein
VPPSSPPWGVAGLALLSALLAQIKDRKWTGAGNVLSTATDLEDYVDRRTKSIRRRAALYVP